MCGTIVALWWIVEIWCWGYCISLTIVNLLSIVLKNLESFCLVFLEFLQFPLFGCSFIPTRSHNCDSLESFCRFRSWCVHGSDHITRSLPWQEVQMLLVLDDASKIDAGEQTYKPYDAFKVVGLEVTPDGVSCFQDGHCVMLLPGWTLYPACSCIATVQVTHCAMPATVQSKADRLVKHIKLSFSNPLEFKLFSDGNVSLCGYF